MKCPLFTCSWTIRSALGSSGSKRAMARSISPRLYGSWLGRRWKHWAVQAYEGDGLAVVRINGIRYERKLVRVFYSPLLEGVIDKKIAKYRSRITTEAIESGETWVFELAPREGV